MRRSRQPVPDDSRLAEASREREEPMISAEEARALFCYDQVTGVLTWRASIGRRITVGMIAGYVDRHSGYTIVVVRARRYFVHRVAWLMVIGSWPANEIDHIDGQRSNNAWANLRDVSRRVNSENQRAARKINKCGLLGVSKKKYSYAANIVSLGEVHYLGRFKTANDAHEAYLVAKRKLHEGGTL